MDQAELAERLKRQEKEAMTVLYDQYADALYGVIVRIVKKEEAAAEVLNDALLRIWNKAESYDPAKARLFTWMMQIARNMAIDKVRSKEFSQAKKTEDIQNHVYSPAGSVEQHEENIGVKELLFHLRDEEQIVIDLVYFQGYTQSEVSEEKNIPIGTVKTRLRMAIQNLRKIIGNR